MAVEIFLSKMSDHMEFGQIICWLVEEGDRVEKGQPILELQTDKAVGEIEAPATGILKGIRAGAGKDAVVPVGEPLAFIAAAAEEVPLLPPLGEAESGETAPVSTPVETHSKPGRLRATPVARRVARDLGVDLAQVTGAGVGGRITEEDVRAFAGGDGSPTETPDDYLELSAAQLLTGQRLLESVQTAPQFAIDVDVDVSDLLALRQRLMEEVVAETGDRLSVTAMLVKIAAVALKRYPRANASFADGRVKLHRQVNVGVAVGTEDGLVVPVVKEADKKSLAQITRELNSYRVKAEEMRFGADELSGGTFTLSNLGMYGVDHFRAIVNPPESAILAVGRIVKTPVGMPDDSIALRPVMNLNLAIDHRSMDGVHGARLLGEIKKQIEKPHSL